MNGAFLRRRDRTVRSLRVEHYSSAVNMLADLRLPTINQLWKSFAKRADAEGWTAVRFLAALAEHELAERDRRRIERHLREARLLPGKSLASFDFKAVPMLAKAQVMALAAGDGWLNQGANCLVFGPPGAGKSHLASAIGLALVENGYRVLFILPSLGLPPVVCWRGTRPSQAEKSRPRRKLSIGGAKAWIAIALIGPIPGTLIRRLASSSCRALTWTSLSRPVIFASRPAICSSRRPPSSRTASGNPEAGPSSAEASRPT